jgi:hypothetical protein
MGRPQEYGDEEQERRESKPRFVYLRCKGDWNIRERRFSGCGKLFTVESDFWLWGVCPECGEQLVNVALDEPAQTRRHIAVSGPHSRLIQGDCVKCANSVYCGTCFGDHDQPKHCPSCSCGKCCAKEKELAQFLYDAIKSGKGRESWRFYLEQTGIKAGPMARTVAGAMGGA